MHVPFLQNDLNVFTVFFPHHAMYLMNETKSFQVFLLWCLNEGMRTAPCFATSFLLRNGIECKISKSAEDWQQQCLVDDIL